VLIDRCEIWSKDENIEINQVFCFMGWIILPLNNMATNAAVGPVFLFNREKPSLLQ